MKGTKYSWTRRRLVTDGLVVLLVLAAPVMYAIAATEAPAGFDNLTNGFESQTQFDLDKDNFSEVEEIADGLGPVYNAQACRECHQNPVTGSSSQILELRAGSTSGGVFTDHIGGSLINNRAIDASIQERLLGTDTTITSRASLSILGDGFVEALPDTFFTGARTTQSNAGLNPGTIINVAIPEGPAGTTRIGRFGWKNQQASLLAFSADAYVNEMGITSPLQPTENTSNGVSVTSFNTANGVPAIQDAATVTNPFGTDVAAFTNFMRSTKVPPRDTALAATPDAVAGASIFHSIGCDLCHVTSGTTVAAGTVLNGGKYTVGAAIGSKTFHPYSDFLLHNVGTGDGIVQNGGSVSRNMVRTPPLWGLRTRNVLLHDGEPITRNNAILAHFGDANPVIINYINLSLTQQNQLISFLNSL
jgi:CxxC motif-containing protein (DUF1111 family)